MPAEYSIAEQVGLLVIASSVTSLVTIFIKEKFEGRKGSEEKSQPSLCQFHALMDGRVMEMNKAIETFMHEMKSIVETYHSIDKKIEVLMAKDSARFKLLESNQSLMTKLIGKMNLRLDQNDDDEGTNE